MQEMIITKPRCKKCGSTQVYIRLTTNDLVCQKCGNISSLDEEKVDG